MDKPILMVGGNARSGTSALARLLNSHPDILLGVERYQSLCVKGELTAELFEKERFLEIQPGDSNQNPRVLAQFDDKDACSKKYDSAKMIGDKSPAISNNYDQLWDNFKDVSVLYIVRNPISVAESYEARRKKASDKWTRGYGRAIKDWNRSINTTLKLIEEGRPIKVIAYERLFNNEEMMKFLFTTLNLDPEKVQADYYAGVAAESLKLAGKPGPRNENLRFDVFRRAATGSYRKLIDKHCLSNEFDAGMTTGQAEEDTAAG